MEKDLEVIKGLLETLRKLGVIKDEIALDLILYLNNKYRPNEPK